jgi:hypothetical protein
VAETPESLRLEQESLRAEISKMKNTVSELEKELADERANWLILIVNN